MSRITADQIQKSGGAVFSLPVASGANNQYIQTDGQGNLSFNQPFMSDPAVPYLISPEGFGNIGSTISHTDRQNIYSTGEWTSGGPWTTWTAYQSHTDNNAIQFMAMALGDGFTTSGTSQYMQGADAENELPRRVQFTNGNRLGFSRDTTKWDNVQDYAGHSMRVMPLRNTTSSPVTVNLYAYTSQYWSSGYEGCQLFYFTPNTSTYSTVTGVTGTSIATSTSNARQVNLTGSATIPANTTILVCLLSTDWYTTTYRYKDTNFFYNLNTTCTTANGVICDMRMLSALARGKFTGLSYAGAFSGLFATIWTSCATIYGDR